MAEPKIVFCSSNHIFDASIYGECPYCKKISEEQKALSDSLGINEDSSELIRDRSAQLLDEYTELLEYDDDHTELLEEDGDCTALLEEEEDEHTEFLNDNHEEIIEENADDEHTELLSSSRETSSGLNKNFVIGWLVFRNGKQKGNCLEIRQATNYLYLHGDILTVSENNFEQGVCLAAISKTKDKFIINPLKNVKCGTNGVLVNKDVILHNYDLLWLDEYEFTFVELLTEFVDWSR